MCNSQVDNETIPVLPMIGIMFPKLYRNIILEESALQETALHWPLHWSDNRLLLTAAWNFLVGSTDDKPRLGS